MKWENILKHDWSLDEVANIRIKKPELAFKLGRFGDIFYAKQQRNKSSRVLVEEITRTFRRMSRFPF